MPKQKSSFELIPSNTGALLSDLPATDRDIISRYDNYQTIVDLIAMGANFLMKTKTFLIQQKLVKVDEVYASVSNIFVSLLDANPNTNLEFPELFDILLSSCETLLDTGVKTTFTAARPTTNLIRKHRMVWLESNRIRVIRMFQDKLDLQNNVNSTYSSCDLYIELIKRMDLIAQSYFYPQLPNQEETFSIFESILEQLINSEFSDLKSNPFLDAVDQVKENLKKLAIIENADTEIIKPITAPPETVDIWEKPDTINLFDQDEPLRLSDIELLEMTVEQKLELMFGSSADLVQSNIQTLLASFDAKYHSLYNLVCEIFINQSVYTKLSPDDFIVELKRFFILLNTKLRRITKNKEDRHLFRATLFAGLREGQQCFWSFDLENMEIR